MEDCERTAAHLIAVTQRLKVNSRRNSHCVVPLDSLDWTRWFTDSSFGLFYLHVYEREGDAALRVKCKLADAPRLACEGGELYWLIDRYSD